MQLQQKVLEMMEKIPKGRVTTYKILGDKLGTKAYRAVGTCVKNNPFAPTIPCHRVVKSDGGVGFYSGSGGIKTKIRMLRQEGILIRKNKIVDFEKVLHKF